MLLELFEPFEALKRGAASSSYTATFRGVPYRDLTPSVLGEPCLACQFPLPFPLLLRSSCAFGMSLGRHRVVILLREERQEAYDKRMPIAQLDGMDIASDRTGVVKYTDVEVQMSPAMFGDKALAVRFGFEATDLSEAGKLGHLADFNEVVEKIAFVVVNRLLRAYRFLSGQHYVRPITRSEVFYMQAGWVRPEGGGLISLAFGAPGQGLTLEAAPFSDDFHTMLGRWLTEDRDVPMWVELMQDATEYLNVGRYRHVVIDTRTALESFVDQTLLKRFEALGVSPLEAAMDVKLSTEAQQSVVSIQDAVRLARINDKLKYGMRKALGIGLAQRKIWQDWIAVKEIREGSVHYGEDVSEENAKLCLETAEHMILAMHEAGSPVSVGYVGSK